MGTEQESNATETPRQGQIDEGLLLQAIVESSDDAIIGKTLDGIIVSWNKGAERLYGYTAEEVKGRPISILMPPDRLDEMPRLLARLREGHATEHHETVRMRKDGTRIDISLTLSPIRNAAGELIGASTIARDVTAGLQTREALRLASAYNRSLIEAALDPLVTIGPDGKITDLNAATEAVTGYSRQELIGTDFSDYFTEPERAQAGYLQVFRDGSVHDYELEIRHRDGHMTPVLYNATIYRDEAGAVIGVFAAARDVTLHKQAEEALRLANAYNRSLIEAALDPLVTIGPDGKITDVNAATEAVTGHARKELIGTDFSRYFTEPEKAEAGYQQVFREGSVHDYELEIQHRDGHLTPVLYNASVYRDEEGQVIGVFAAARDIAARKQAEEVIARQAEEILDISTPIVQLWQGVLATPLIGTLDSQRSQRIMEQLLQRIVDTSSPVVLLDITGVPTIDTQTARHLLETIDAVRFLGAQVIVTGVRPAIARTLVHLGIRLTEVITRSSLAAGLQVALDSLGLEIVPKAEGH